jgi:hypothetical protein
MSMVWSVYEKPKTENLRAQFNELRSRIDKLRTKWIKQDDEPAGQEIIALRAKLIEISQSPYETLNLKRLKDLDQWQKVALYEKYIMPKIKALMIGDFHPWKTFDEYREMTLDKFFEVWAESYSSDSAPEEIKKEACIGGRFCSRYSPIEFEFEILYWGNRVLPHDVASKSQSHFFYDGMVQYSAQLEKYKILWEDKNPELMNIIIPHKEQLVDYERDTHWT